MLTTTDSISLMAKMKLQTHFMRVSLSTPPHTEHMTFCLQHSFMNESAHSGCSMRPLSGSESSRTSMFQTVTAIKTPQPKCSLNSMSSVVVARALSGLRRHISLAFLRKSSAVGSMVRGRLCPVVSAIVDPQ